MTRSTDATDGRATFTPGPWALGTIEQNDGSVAVMDASSDRVARVDAGLKRGAANARLIAAAPELYAALWALVDYRGSDPGAHGRRLVAAARAALAKVDA